MVSRPIDKEELQVKDLIWREVPWRGGRLMVAKPDIGLIYRAYIPKGGKAAARLTVIDAGGIAPEQQEVAVGFDHLMDATAAAQEHFRKVILDQLQL